MRFVPLLLGLLVVPLAAPAAADTRVLRQPDVGQEVVVFAHAGDLWVAPRDGGDARRLTTSVGIESDPALSPDGTLVAFAGQYDGNTDVYVVPVEGGEPRRLTWHPGFDVPCGWTPEGAVLFTSSRTSVPRANPQLWTIALDAAMPERLPLPRGSRGSISADGGRLAYRVVSPWDAEWRNYRGGQAQPIRVVDLKTLEMTKLPWKGSNDLDPVWLGDTIFFLSDRDLAMNVWAYDVATGSLSQRTHFKEFDCKQLGGTHDRLVFENGGYLWTLEAAGGEAVRLSIDVRGDFPQARPHWEDVSKMVRSVALSPGGKRVLFEARGEIFAVPADKGDTRNLSTDSSSADREPSWSPDGSTVAWFSDRSGEYQLVFADAYGDEQRRVDLPEPCFPYTPVWSPDSKYLAFGDQDRELWVVEVATSKFHRIDGEGSAHPARWIRPAWSPDSRWIAYSRRLDNQFNGVFLYSVADGRITQLSDGLSDAFQPAFDRGGKYLYFMASTDYGMNVGWLDMSSYEHPAEYTVYCAVLQKDEPSPQKPQSDEETPEEESAKDEKEGEKKDEKKDDGAGVEVRIDFEGLAQRIVALDVPARSYVELGAGAEGSFFYRDAEDSYEPVGALYRYDMGEREETEIASGVAGFEVSADGSKLLYGSGGSWTLIDATGTSEGAKPLDLGGLRMKVDPPAEWAQIFREAWRHQRDYFYVRNVHGLDMDWAYRAYSPWVDDVRHGDDLTYVIDILGGETCVGHSFTRRGDVPDVDRVPVGLLGVDVAVDRGRYRITKLYTGENWNPDLHAPLSGPGLDAKVGDYIVAVDGEEIVASRNFYSYFDRKADRQTRIALNSRPQLEGARESIVLPVADENPLRRRDWVEANRRKVDELSEGKLAYVWVPDTGGGGYTYFNRYFFAQMNKKGAVIDERFNNGGSIADYIVDALSRKQYGYFNNPVGGKKPWTAPNAALWGPKVMLINEMSGSGGDMLPFMFRFLGIGPLVGTRTWGGLVGIWDVPGLIDGGYITAPRGGFYNMDGEWDVEGEGVPPDVEVEETPLAFRDGRDLQLERAVQIALEAVAREKVQQLPQPPDPIRSLRPE